MKRLKRLLIIIGGIYLIFGLIIFVFQRKFIYYPTGQNFNDCANFANASKVIREGTRMYVHKSTDSWIVVYHGNAGSACDRSYFLDYFNPQNYSYIVVEYAGYSNDDDNQPSQNALMGNVKTVIDYLNEQHPLKVAVVGESLGTALAAYHGSLKPPDKLLLISPFDSLENAAQFHYWFYPIKLILLDKYPSKDWARSLNNAHIIHGTKDTVIPISSAKKLYQQISGSNKTFIEIPGAGHNDIYDFPLARESIIAFFQ